jgi:hypothetical protein
MLSSQNAGGIKMVSEKKSRVESDSKGERTKYEDILEGTELGEIEWELAKESINKQCKIDDDYNEWYTINSPFEGVIAPPQITYRPPRCLISRKYNIRGVFYKWEFENVDVLKENSKIIVNGKVLSKWIKNDREYVKFEVIGKDTEGKVVFKTYRTHVLDVIKIDAPRVGAGIDSGIKAEKI